ncbi:zinc finger BED domain-containing protein RICESLEEPER 3-like [Apium graveolens]|uniref:zinc finger BED domain-containing protein RICESLEEPER 3-like n=1 Tax=Apium graveolens TaxID=4045 RepID=UPI003D7A7DF8
MSSDYVSSPIENGTGNQNQNHSGFHTQEAPITNEAIRKRDIDQSTGSASLVVQYVAKKVIKKETNLKGYMTITAHYVDPNWKLHKRVINFCHIPPPHTGLMISDAIFSCLNAWGIENKISTITLDNASSNDSAVRHLKDSFSLKGYEYPTSNIFLPEIWKIKELLLSTCVDDSEFMRNMAMKMKVNFDKYWSECNLLMAIASVLDLRYKMYLIHFCFPKIYLIDAEAKRNADFVVKTLHELYTHYAANHCKGQSSGSLPATSCVASAVQLTGGLNMTKSIAEFNSWDQGIDHVSPLKSDIDVYLEEVRYICSAGESFDALQWWKSNILKFRVLLEMAKDILYVPITTVASESKFSAGGRVLDQYRSSLKPNTVEALICTSDWLRAEYKISNSAPSTMFDEEGDLTDSSGYSSSSLLD